MAGYRGSLATAEDGMSQHADRSSTARARRQRNATIAIIGVVGLAAFVGGFAIANLDDGGTTAASSSPSRTKSRSASASASASVSTPPSVAVADGRYFVQTHAVKGGEDRPLLLSYDLAYFYTGDQAVQVAEKRGDPPPESGYYIVNDNPRLRVVPVASDATVMYVPQTICCEPVDGDLGAWALSVNGTAQTDYPDPDIAWWWIRVSSGEITTIEQQYLP
jgi:hypothetical protein